MAVVFVCCTRSTKAAFIYETALGRSLRLTFKAYPIKRRLFAENSRGLGECYSEAINEQGDGDDILIFVHDDVFILDYFLLDRLAHGFARFDLLGVAGNKRRVPRQPAWAFIDDKFTWDDPAFLSGAIGHGTGFPCPLSIYGPAFQQCRLLEGVLLAAKRKSFAGAGIRFDPQFKFHFYDMDICRQFEANNLRMGTIPLSIIHESGGPFGTPDWREAYERYLAKWRE